MAKPSLYLNSTLFPWGKKKKTKVLDRSVSMPDEQNEDLQPDEEEGIASVVSGDSDLQRSEAVNILKSLIQKAEPDVTGELEGKFDVPLDEMISQLNKIVSAEYSQWMRWYHYAIVLRGHCRDSLAEHFSEHAEEELAHADAVAMRVIGLGGYPTTDMEHPDPLKDTEEIIKELLLREQEGMALYKKVHALCGENEGTRQILEGNMGQEQEHIDDLWRYLKNPEMIKAGADQESAGSHTMPSEVQAKRTADNSFRRRAVGISGTSTPDKPEVGRDWHGTVPGVPDEPQDTEEEKEEAAEAFAPPKDVFGLKKKKPDQNPNISKSMTEAFSVLDSVPQFQAPHQFSLREREYLLSKGFSSGEIDTGDVEITPRMRREFRTHVRGSVIKSINSLQQHRR